MESLPHFTPKLVVGVGSLLLTLVATWATVRASGYPADRALSAWPTHVLGRLRRELPRGDLVAGAWVALAAWSLLVSGLHFGGVYYNVYTALPWWDLMTHAMGGFGVAALLALTFRESTLRSPTWVVTGVLAIGAGFEVYEFVFKTFWYHWTLEFYVVDTVIDLIVNTLGSVLLAGAVILYRSQLDSRATDGDPLGTDSD